MDMGMDMGMDMVGLTISYLDNALKACRATPRNAAQHVVPSNPNPKP